MKKTTAWPHAKQSPRLHIARKQIERRPLHGQATGGVHNLLRCSLAKARPYCCRFATFARGVDGRYGFDADAVSCNAYALHAGYMPQLF